MDVLSVICNKLRPLRFWSYYSYNRSFYFIGQPLDISFYHFPENLSSRHPSHIHPLLTKSLFSRDMINLIKKLRTSFEHLVSLSYAIVFVELTDSFTWTKSFCFKSSLSKFTYWKKGFFPCTCHVSLLSLSGGSKLRRMPYQFTT